MNDPKPLFAVLRQAADPAAAAAMEKLVAKAPDQRLCRINVLSFAAEHGLDEEKTIAAFLHAARLGLFEMSWNVLCPGCGGVLDAGTSLKTVQQDEYACSLCASGYEPTLDEMVEVTFTVSPRVRRIAAHDPDSLSFAEYCRQVYWSSGVDLPEGPLDDLFAGMVLETLDLAPREKAIIALQMPAEFLIVFDPVTHTAQFIDVQGEPTTERQALSFRISRVHAHNETRVLRPGPLRLTVENETDDRVLPSVFIAGHKLHDLLGRRRPFLTAKRLLTNQTFRDIHRTDTLDVDQRLKITSLTFLFTDLRGSTELYDRVGDLVAFDLVKAHFGVLHEIVASEAGAVVKTIGDAVMATFPTPDRALAAALRIRAAMLALNVERGREDLLLKIGIHEGPCIAVTLNDRQDYFGQTVNIASRVQHLAKESAIFATGRIVDDPRASALLRESGIAPVSQVTALRGVAEAMHLYAIP